MITRSSVLIVYSEYIKKEISIYRGSGKKEQFSSFEEK